MKKNQFIVIAFLAFTSIAFSQRAIVATDYFVITGKVDQEQQFTVKMLDNFPKTKVKDLVLYNHKGEVKDTIINMKGVLLKDVLAKTKLSYDKPKELNEFYFVCSASDGYKVVFSWNEIYNTDIGDNLYFITEMDGKSLKDIEQRIILLSSSDLKAGRRYIKALQKIEVKKAE